MTTFLRLVTGMLALLGALEFRYDTVAQTSAARPADAPSVDGRWLTYSGSYRSEHFSPLKEISTTNVAGLRPVWVYQPPGTGSLEATPIVAHGMMYVTSGPATVVALDLKTGKALWRWTRAVPASALNLGFPRVNRGVAILDNTVFVSTLDGYL